MGQARVTKFGTNISNEMLLNVAKCQGYSFCRFLDIKRKPTGDKLLSLAQIRVNNTLTT